MSASSFFAARPIGTETMLVVIGMVAGVAPALAFYPTTVQVAVEKLEPQFHNLKRKDGSPVKVVSFYKGL